MQENKRIYLEELNGLSKVMKEAETTPFGNYAKVVCLVLMNMRYEKIAFDSELKEHPYVLTKKIIVDAVRQFEHFIDISFIEDNNLLSVSGAKSSVLEEKHKELWQEIWTRHNEKEFEDFIDLKVMRLQTNDLTPHINGQDCVDFGCGNGSFSFALLKCGANHVTGIDFGDKSVNYVRDEAIRRNLKDKTDFRIANVTNTNLPGNSFGFAVSNGVFHHLNEHDVMPALKEVARVLKSGGWFWYYVDGKDAISMDLWDETVSILQDVDVLFIEGILKMMNIRRNKMVHIMDSFSATYLHSTLEEVEGQLTECGFGNFKRLTGATSTDFDADVIALDPFGEEKFGTGDLRIACQLINK